MACNIEAKNRLITRYTNIYKSAGMTLEEAKREANLRFNSISSEEAVTPTEITESTDIDDGYGKFYNTQRKYEEDFNFAAKLLGHYSNLTPTKTSELFDRLATVGNVKDSAIHTSKLRSILSSIVNPLLPNIQNVRVNVGELSIPATIGEFRKDIVSIVVANSNYAAPSSFEQSAQEVYVEEMVHAVVNTGLRNPLYSSTVEKLLVSTKNQLNARHNGEGWRAFTNSNKDEEITAAKEFWEYVFGSKNAIDEFLTKGLVNERFTKVLSTLTYAKEKNAKAYKISDAVFNLWKDALDWVMGFLFKADVGNNKRERLQKVTMDKALLAIAMKAGIVHNATESKLINGYGIINKGNKFIRKTVAKALDTHIKEYFDAVSKNPNKSNITRLAAEGVATIIEVGSYAKDKTLTSLYNGIDTIRIPILGRLNNLVRELPAQMLGTNYRFETIHALKKEAEAIPDRSKREIYSSMLRYLKESFTEPLTKEEDIALTSGILKSGIYRVFNDYKDNLDKLFNEDFIDKEISTLTNSMKQFGVNTNNYIRQAQSLAAVSMGYSPMIGNTMLNAYNIADGVYEGGTFRRIGDRETAIRDIRKLTSLFAIKYLQDSDRVLLHKVVSREFKNNSESNGITAIVGQAFDFYAHSVNDIFKDDQSQLTDNYIRETHYDKYSIKYGTKADEKEYAKEGYVIHREVQKDEADSFTGTIYEYRAKGHELTPRVRGALSLIDTKERGSTIQDRAHILKLDKANRKANVVNARLRKYYRRNMSMLKNKEVDLSAKPNYTDSFAIPLIEDSEIVGYRYLDNDQVKNSKQFRDSRAMHVLATMFSRRVDEVESAKVNKEVTTFIKTDATEYIRNKKNFILLTPDSTNPDIVEAFKLIPSLARADLKETIKQYEGLPIRKELYKTIFGFRKVAMFNNQYLRQIEQFLHEIVSVAKRNFVIKTGMAIPNYVSNIFQLEARGVPADYSYRKQKEAWIGIRQYLITVNKKTQLELKLKDSNLTVPQKLAIKQDITRFEGMLEKNPIMSLIDMGYLSTIVEDIEIDSNTYRPGSVQSYYSKFRETLTDKAPKPVSSLIDELLMNENTWMYKSLDELTKYGDFVARYTYMSWLLEKENLNDLPTKIPPTMFQPALEKQARRLNIPVSDLSKVMYKVRNEFVDYSAVTSPEIQYLDDVGVFWFIKYPLRILRIILDSIKNTPINAISTYLTASMLNISAPTDFSYNIHSPLFATDGFGLFGLEAYMDLAGLATDPLAILE